MKESVYMRMGNHSYDAGKYHAAFGYFREEIRSSPNNIDALLRMGLIKFRFREFDMALNLFNRILDIQRDHEEAERYIGLIRNIIAADFCASSDECTVN